MCPRRLKRGHHGQVDWKLLVPFALGRKTGAVDGGHPPDESFLGGMRLGGYNATWPLVRLNLYPAGLRMEPPVRFLRFLVPTWEARYDELIEVQAVGKIPLFSTGIRFRLTSTNQWIIYWTPDRPTVLQSIAAHGMSVNPNAIRFRYWNPGR